MNNKKIPSFHVLLLAAGGSVRLGAERPKPYLELAGKPLLTYSLDIFLGQKGLQSLQVVIRPEDEVYYRRSIEGYDLPSFIVGGKSRKDSVYNGLNGIPDANNEEIVLIHDAARPFVTNQDTHNLLLAAKEHGAATLATPVADTLRQGNPLNIAQSMVDRNGLWALQTPQAFKFGLLKKAHESADPHEEYTDDTSLVSALGHPVKLVPGSRKNFKITYPEDLDMAETFLEIKNTGELQTRIGSGYDVHRFEEAPSGKPLLICGIAIDHANALEGHSDADVGLHAITDALLGALGKGDIGQHFPPSNPAYKDMDSAIFLEKAAEILAMQQGFISNLDVTLVCETPKIGPYREKMAENIARILKIQPGRVNVKATTTERLGAMGRGEGIACSAVIAIETMRYKA